VADDILDSQCLVAPILAIGDSSKLLVSFRGFRRNWNRQLFPVVNWRRVGLAMLQNYFLDFAYIAFLKVAELVREPGSGVAMKLVTLILDDEKWCMIM